MASFLNCYGFVKQAGLQEVACVALWSNGKLLMGRRRDNNRWTQAGGHLNPGEDPAVGAVREVKEETGIDITPKQLQHLRSEVVTKPDGKKLKIHAYLVKLPDAEKATMKEDPDAEVQRWHWITLEKLHSPEVWDHLHVPPEDNVMMKELGMQKTAGKLNQYHEMSWTARNASDIENTRKFLVDNKNDLINEVIPDIEAAHQRSALRSPESTPQHLARGALAMGIPGAVVGGILGAGAGWKGIGRGALIGGLAGGTGGGLLSRGMAKREREDIARSKSLMGMSPEDRRAILRQDAEKQHELELQLFGDSYKTAAYLTESELKEYGKLKLKAPKHSDDWYPKDQLGKGQKVEKEHTGNARLRDVIGKNHLDERRDYYNNPLFKGDLEKKAMKEFWAGFEKKALSLSGAALGGGWQATG